MKQTIVYKMSNGAIDKDAINNCAEIIKHGGLVVFPTETVYGIACRGDDEAAIKSLYEAKERPLDKPLLAHLYDISQADEIAYLSHREKKLIKRHAPGPLTVIARKKPCVPDIMTSGGDTVGLRFPSDPIGLEFMKACGCVLAATSANISGETAGITGEQAAKELFGRVDAIIDTGKTKIGLPSTIVSLKNGAKILREGAIDGETILRELSMPDIIGVCGRSGSGKSTFCRELQKRGYTVIDTDEVYHSLIADGGSECTEALCARFGDGILSGGIIDRSKLRQIVFADQKALDDLNAVSHRYVLSKVKKIIAEHVGEEMIFVDIPLMFESGFDKQCDLTVCIWADDGVCTERICARDGISPADAKKRLSKQGDFRTKCDIVINNSGNINELKSKIDDFLKKVRDE